ncbi:TPA: hypothetical protein ACHLAK_004962, partial [Escherichia coli]
ISSGWKSLDTRTIEKLTSQPRHVLAYDVATGFETDDTESKIQGVKNFSWNKCLKIVHEKSINYITLKKNIPSLLEATTCFQVSFRRDLPQIG